MESCLGNFKRALKEMGKRLKSVKAYILIIIIVFGIGFLFLMLNYERDWRPNTISDDNTPLKVNEIYYTADNFTQDTVFNDNVWVTDCNVTFKNCTWTGEHYLRIRGILGPAIVTLEESNVYDVRNENGSCIVKNSNITQMPLWDNASVDMENSRCYQMYFWAIFNPVISIRNSTLCLFGSDNAQDAQVSVVDTIFRDLGATPSIGIAGTSSLYMENCSGPIRLNIEEDSTATLENCNFTSHAYYVDIDSTTTIEANNCRFYYIQIPDGNLTLTDSEFLKATLKFDCTLDETLELNSLSANVVLSNFKLTENDLGRTSCIAVGSGCTFNISNIRKAILPRLELNVWPGGELFAQNCDISRTYDFFGIIQARWQNCTFEKTWVRNGLSVFSECTFRNLIDIDTTTLGPTTIEKSEFVDAVIHVISGGVNIDNCNFTTDIGLLWLEKSPDAFAFINNSNPKQIKLTLNTDLVAENLICDTIRMDDTSNGVFKNVTVRLFEVMDLANATIDNCRITDIDFQSPNIQITNSIVDAMAPTPDPIPSPLINSSDFLLDWNSQPGQNLSGNIASYRIFRADKPVGSGAPLPSEFELIHTIINPNPTNSSDTQYYDTELTVPSSLDGRHLYYMVKLRDDGNNAGNSTVLSTVYDTTITLGALDAQVYFNDLLTTYDEINVSVYMVDADINENGTHDCGEAKLYCTFLWNDGTNSSQEFSSLGTSIDGIVYYFTIPQSYNATDIYFSAVIHQSSSYDSYGVGEFDFNSTIKYGSPFHVFAPTIAFTPVSHPSEHNILESEAIILSVNVLKNAEYITHVQVHYRFEGQSWMTMNMTYDSGKVEFSITLPNLNLGVLEYYVTYNNLGNQQYNLLRSAADPETKNIIPAFPINQLEVGDLLVILIGSVLAGVGISLVYILIDSRLKKREQVKRKQKLKAILEVPGKSIRKKRTKNVEWK